MTFAVDFVNELIITFTEYGDATKEQKLMWSQSKYTAVCYTFVQLL